MELASNTANACRTVIGTHNLRDTGGYAADTGRTRWGKLYRSDALHLVTDAGLEELTALRLCRVIDLRDDSELASSPSRLDGIDAIVHHTPIFAGPAVAPPDAQAKAPGSLQLNGMTLTGLYRLMLDRFAANLVAAVRIIARSGEEPVLVHCTAGKDRTGMVVALSLLAAGVDRDAVVADYAATEENLRGDWSTTTLQKMVDSGLAASSELEQIATGSPAAAMEEIIDHLKADYGSAAAFLLANGLTQNDLDDLRSALIDPESTSTPTTQKENHS